MEEERSQKHTHRVKATCLLTKLSKTHRGEKTVSLPNGAGHWTHTHRRVNKIAISHLLRIPFKVQGPMKSPARLMLQLPLCSSGFQVTALLGLILSSTFSNLFHISSLYITVVESPSFIWHYSGSHWAPVLFQVLGFLEGYFHLKRQNGEMGNKFIYMNIYIYMYTK